MALVDCTITVTPSRVNVSTAVASTVVVEPVSTTVVVTGQVGIRGPKGDPGDVAEYPQFLAGENLSAHRVIRVVEEMAYYCNGSNSAHSGTAIGLSMGAVINGDMATIQTSGMVQEFSWTFTEGPVFVGANGQLTQSLTGLAFVQQIGVAVSATQININPQLAILH